MAAFRPAGLLRRFRKNREGSAAVEFAMVAFPFFFLLFAAIETAVAMGGNVLLDNAVHNVARRVMTGQTQTADVTPENFKQSICDQVSFLLSCSTLKVDMRTYATFADIPVDVPRRLGKLDDTGFCFDPGAQGDITVVRAFYAWPWIANMLGDAVRPAGTDSVLFSMAAFMNEPFGAGRSTRATC